MPEKSRQENTNAEKGSSTESLKEAPVPEFIEKPESAAEKEKILEHKREEKKNPEKIQDLKENIDRLIGEKPNAPAAVKTGQNFLEDYARIQKTPRNMLGRILKAVEGRYDLDALAAYFDHHGEKSIAELQENMKADTESMPELQKVSSIEEVDMGDEKKGRLVRMRRGEWPALSPQGIAFLERGVAIVPECFFPSAQKAIDDHEAYHLRHHSAPNNLAEQISEIETLWNANVRHNLPGSILFVAERLADIPTTLKNVAKNIFR